MKTDSESTEFSRRDFLKTSSSAALGTAFGASLLRSNAEESGSLRIGLVGCGGRGTGAAAQALGADKNVKLVAMGDAFRDRLESSLKTLQTQDKVAEKIEVPDENRFVGFDAYKEVLKRVDVVLLATPPHFRPIHIK